jgi:hypothetical protein
MSSVNDALITSGITSGVFLIYKIVQHYRLRSSCNQDNQLVVEIVDIERPIEKKDEEKHTTHTEASPV